MQLRTALLPLALGATACRALEPTPPEPWNCSARVELSTVWASVARRHDANGDGQVTSEEYTRGAIRFANYDRNEDGVLDASDFPTDTHFNGFSHMLVGRADLDGDEAVTRHEWTIFAEAFDVNLNGRVERWEVQETMGAWTSDWRLFLLSFDQDGDGDFDESDLDATFRDQDFNGDGTLAGKELEGWQSVVGEDDEDVRPPAPGEPAPDFDLSHADDPTRTFHLDAERRVRPVALIFGSYT
jgi:Ca2+-binding EF-hand superfamily protein